MIARHFLPHAELDEASVPGYRLVATCADPNVFACATMSDQVKVFHGPLLTLTVNMQRFAVKSRAEWKIQRLAFSHDGGKIFVACGSGIDCFDTTTGDLDWEYRPGRLFGFLRSTPLDMVVCDDDGVLFSTNTGNITRLDRKGRVDFTVFDNDAPQSFSRLAGQAAIVGGDGQVVHVWSADDGSRVRTAFYSGRHYTVAASRDTVAIRIPGAYVLLPLTEDKPSVTVPCKQGLPAMAWSVDGTRLATIQEESLVVYDQFGNHVHRFEPTGTRVVSVAAVQTSGGFMVGCGDETIHRLDC